ncbi:response regulator transcription factor [Halalkalibacter akibai]|uniref:Phosphate regulon transcriptional regulatory protein PhoB n=1 Tax=Halalkalibacter akibai (strain ATCC 43226 / DSM 21942 / CIP 109018 / JCM 9157 / 1139) TaxID=1236973 RepID=W4QSR6_HALA3|nr:response regulator transcription factor [Halalkalibacter akibai]GAE35175.1 phosphate regulon transcriptional regulatory protein PhoB [Halalkalibacter akibai JCM 9157]
MIKQLKVLIIEDDPNISDLIQMYTEKENFKSIIANNGEEGLSKYYDEDPDFVLLDIMLPEINGWDICQLIRKDKSFIPIIMLTGKGENYDKIKGLEIGADDYIVKPFDPNELIARMKAVIRRAYPAQELKEDIELPSLLIDITQYKVYRNDTQVIMPPKELELLYFLAYYQNQVFTRQQLLEKIWGMEYEGDPRTIDVHIKRVREKIGDHSPLWTLKTIRGVGYKFEVNADV